MSDVCMSSCTLRTLGALGIQFDHLLSLVKEYVVGVWDARKQKLYGDDWCPSQLQSLAEDLQLAGVRGKRMVSYVSQVREEQMVRICLCVSPCASPCKLVQ